MVSTRSALKRPLPNDEYLKPSKRARNEVQPARARSLMDLPPEVRRVILIELLCYRHPLEFNSAAELHSYAPSSVNRRDKLLLQTSAPANGRLHPRILRACRQLHLEGSEILYSNTINCRVGEPFMRVNDGRSANFILSQRYQGMVSQLPQAVVQKMSKVRIQLFAHHQRDKRDLSTYHMEDGIQELALEFRKALAWKHIEIEVTHVYRVRKLQRQSRDAADSIAFAAMLHPWRYVRNRTSVTVSGLSSKLITALPTIMTSTGPFVDLPLAKTALEDYLRFVCDFNSARGNPVGERLCPLLDQRAQCIKAVRREDVGLFIRSRKRAMAILNSIVIRQEARVFEHDPNHWDTGPDLTATAPDDGLSGPPDEEEDRPLSDYDSDEAFDDEETDAYDESDISGDSDDSDEDDWDSDGDPWGNGGGCECEQCASME